MIVYLDVVFFLNFFLDFILLMGVSIILTRNAKIKRIILGSIIGGISTFLLFINLNNVLLIIFKLLLGLFMVIKTFGYRDIKYTLNNLFYLYTLSFSVGGAMYLLMGKGYYNYFVLIVGFIIILFIYLKQARAYQNTYANYYTVELYLKSRKYLLTGFLDTGNKLYDNYQHRPVIIISKKIKYELEDVIYVPFVSLNNQSVLKCLKTDKIIINNHIFKNYLVGISNKAFKIEGINCLLHSKMKGDLHA